MFAIPLVKGVFRNEVEGRGIFFIYFFLVLTPAFCYDEVMKVINRTKVIKKYKGLWVGFKQDQETVVSSGKTLKEALDKAHKKGCSNPIMSFMNPNMLLPQLGAYSWIPLEILLGNNDKKK